MPITYLLYYFTVAISLFLKFILVLTVQWKIAYLRYILIIIFCLYLFYTLLTLDSYINYLNYILMVLSLLKVLVLTISSQENILRPLIGVVPLIVYSLSFSFRQLLIIIENQSLNQLFLLLLVLYSLYIPILNSLLSDTLS